MEVLYSDDNLLVVNKPSGLATVPGNWEKESISLVKQLETDYDRLWVVHRLDKATSGLVVFARNSEAHRLLSMQFEHHETHKLYHAIVIGIPAWKDHTARHPLLINVGHSHRTVVDHTKGKPSETVFHLLERYDGYALISAIPSTGRTHQVRVHAFALGYPLLGDTLYSAPASSLIARPALHAQSLQFTFENQPFDFIAPYPADFTQALNKLRAGY
ncbi:MAG: RluA family pseudouridine synthase [Anaerolineales bacterium]|jgi:RluA family pseudouridine synthase